MREKQYTGRLTIRLSPEQMLWLSDFPDRSEAIRGLLDDHIYSLKSKWRGGEY